MNDCDNILRVIERSSAGNNTVDVMLCTYVERLHDVKHLKTFTFRGTIESNTEILKCICHYINMGYTFDDYMYPHELTNTIIRASKSYLKDRSVLLSLSGVAKVAGIKIDTFKGWYNKGDAMSLDKVAKLIDVVSQI